MKKIKKIKFKLDKSHEVWLKFKRCNFKERDLDTLTGLYDLYGDYCLYCKDKPFIPIKNVDNIPNFYDNYLVYKSEKYATNLWLKFKLHNFNKHDLTNEQGLYRLWKEYYRYALDKKIEFFSFAQVRLIKDPVKKEEIIEPIQDNLLKIDQK